MASWPGCWAKQIEVNSLHWQAIDRLAPRLTVEGRSDDGVVEAVRVNDAAAFALGVQWHPEYKSAKFGLDGVVPGLRQGGPIALRTPAGPGPRRWAGGL